MCKEMRRFYPREEAEPAHPRTVSNSYRNGMYSFDPWGKANIETPGGW